MIRIVSLFSGALALGACTPAPPPNYLAAPADATSRARPANYQSITAGTQTFRPVDPKGWEELNSRVGPKKEGTANDR
jgi:hypothetical protein